jgi:putative two-component system response regulator
VALKEDPATRLIPIVLMTGSAEHADHLLAIESGADDFLRKPIDVAELKARARSLIRLKRHTDELESAENVIMSLALMIEARDPTTGGHCQRLAAASVAVGRRLRLTESELVALHLGGYLHDIGKIAVPDAILTKPGPLTEEEFAVIRDHPVTGDRLCGTLRSLQAVRPIVRHHHERCDGSGYPDHLVGDDIPVLAQIVAVADVFDALTSIRPYKPAWSYEAAFAELGEEVARGRLPDDVVGALRDAWAAGELGGDQDASLLAP